MSNQQQDVDCVMPAAGLSSRMGSWKMMLPYRHHTILDESIENALRFCSRVILVVGHRGNELIERYENSAKIRVVVNSDYPQGMFSSIQAGVSEVRSEHFFVCHGDMPCVSADIYQQVWSERGEHTVFPGTKEKPGHPVLLPKSIIPVIQRSEIDGKMKPLIMANKVKFLGLEQLDIYLDVDTPAAYQAVCESAHHKYQIDN
ncbi:molybdenum cofactor cytidylyltransferase [Photobacterium sp.]|uniref:molybdenum cofactor cytidylyltransferase n=1 Tax=Photobacterium sp. TaxID=660 RepID=UPI00299E58E9|nr:molybdenum cofactor cytidylyltransferase [Photobacterium sp.]MDX1303570.1 molybdenum cofactor cytidylyltransferase [Photobacterium sp.]